MKLTNLKEHKIKKKFEKVVADINSILLVFDLASRGLAHFRSYIAVQEIISILITNATLLKLQQKKMQKELDQMKEEKNG